MHRIYIRMVRFGIIFVLLASAGTFGAIWLLGNRAGGGGYASLD